MSAKLLQRGNKAVGDCTHTAQPEWVALTTIQLTTYLLFVKGE